MENNYPIRTIDSKIQKAIYLIKNGTMEDFTRWMANYLIINASYIDNNMIYANLKNIYLELHSNEPSTRELLDRLEYKISHLHFGYVDGFLLVMNQTLWSLISECVVMEKRDDNSYVYINGFTEDGIGSIPHNHLATEEETRKILDDIIGTV